MQPDHAGFYRITVQNAANTNGTSATFSLVVIADTDGDGMPDEWEQTYGLNPNDPTDAAWDTDGDLMTNNQEYIAGTDPLDSSSYLRIDISPEGLVGLVTLWFVAQPYKTYTLEYSEGAGWSKLTDVVARTNRRIEYVLDPASHSKRYYRLETPRQP